MQQERMSFKTATAAMPRRRLPAAAPSATTSRKCRLSPSCLCCHALVFTPSSIRARAFHHKAALLDIDLHIAKDSARAADLDLTIPQHRHVIQAFANADRPRSGGQPARPLPHVCRRGPCLLVFI